MADDNDALRRELAEDMALRVYPERVSKDGFSRLPESVQADCMAIASSLIAGPIAKHIAALQAERDVAIKVQEMAATSGGFYARNAENAERQRDAALARAAELEAEVQRLLAAITEA